ncbi:hypothetical protein ACFGW3_11175 [Pasteurella multocida]|uniref:hypothetical protein n=1 Tax=Pasteurella multocida TaxID=747 RepID=UPI00294510E6|nr:hypothetical protein [Pasteurella multocida]
MNNINLDRAIRALELLRQIIIDLNQENINNTNQSDAHLEYQAHIISSLEKEAYNLKKEVIKTLINANIPNKKIAAFFEVTPARISQLKSEIKKEEERRNILDKVNLFDDFRISYLKK